MMVMMQRVCAEALPPEGGRIKYPGATDRIQHEVRTGDRRSLNSFMTILVMNEFKDLQKENPDFFEMTVAAKVAAMKNAAFRINIALDSEDSDGKDDKHAVGEVAEQPQGIPLCPPRFFSARSYTWYRS